MGGEVYHREVDTSLASFTATFGRSEVLDFTQGVFPVYKAVLIKRPLRTDLSLRYFWLGNLSHLQLWKKFFFIDFHLQSLQFQAGFI